MTSDLSKLTKAHTRGRWKAVREMFGWRIDCERSAYHRTAVCFMADRKEGIDHPAGDAFSQDKCQEEIDGNAALFGIAAELFDAMTIILAAIEGEPAAMTAGHNMRYGLNLGREALTRYAHTIERKANHGR